MLNNLGILEGNKIIQKVVLTKLHSTFFFIWTSKKTYQLPSLTLKKSALLQLTNIYFNEEISGRNQKKRADMSD